MQAAILRGAGACLMHSGLLRLIYERQLPCRFGLNLPLSLAGRAH